MDIQSDLNLHFALYHPLVVKKLNKIAIQFHRQTSELTQLTSSGANNRMKSWLAISKTPLTPNKTKLMASGYVYTELQIIRTDIAMKINHHTVRTSELLSSYIGTLPTGNELLGMVNSHT